MLQRQSGSDQKVPRVPIGILAGRALVFDVEDVKRLRSLGICGVLSGTLPTAPQQNIFLGLPLQLMAEEVIWLCVHGYAVLVPSKEFVIRLIKSLSQTELLDLANKRSKDLEDQKIEKAEKLKLKLKSINKSYDSVTAEDPLITQSLFISIKDNCKDSPHYDLILSAFEKFYLESSSTLKIFADLNINFDRLNYSIYQHLKHKGYFLAPGLRFGGKFIAYPGDPLRYHAHLIVNPVKDFENDDIGLMNIVNGGRLATGVKKIWLIASAPQNGDDDVDVEVEDLKKDDVISFSIEWAGFG